MDETTEKPRKGKGMLFGLVAAVLLAGGGGYAAYSGLVAIPGLGDKKSGHADAKSEHTASAKSSYVQLDPIVVDFGRGGRGGRLRVSLAIETDASDYSTISDRKYRIVDTLYSFLRAVREEDLRDPSKTDLLRSRILRRVLLETPQGTVTDVLISELVIL